MRHALAFGSVVLLLLFTAAVAEGAMTASIVSQDAAWPTGAVIDTGAPNFPVDPLGPQPDYEGERDVKNQRPHLQTFLLSQELVVTDIYIRYNNPNTTVSDGFELRVYETPDVFNSGTAGDNDITDLTKLTLLGSAALVHDHTDQPATSDANMHFSVSGLTLPPLAGPAGYGVMLYNPDTDGILPFKWAGEREVDVFADGRAYSDSGTSWTSGHDWSLAIVPEPASALLLLAAGGMMIRRRR